MLGDDRRRVERRALAEALLGAAAFGAIVMVGGTLAILLISLLQRLGWWGTPV